MHGCGVSRRYIDVCYCDMFRVVNVYLDYLKFGVLIVYGISVVVNVMLSLMSVMSPPRGDLRKEPARWRSLLCALDLGLVLYECLPPIPSSGTPFIGTMDFSHFYYWVCVLVWC